MTQFHMKRWLKRIGTVIALACAIFSLLWILLAGYVHYHKQELLKTITEKINDHIEGEVKIQNLDLSLLRSFPGIAADLEQVVVYDTAWHRHGHELLRAEHIYVSLNIFSILSKSPNIRNIEIENATVYLFTDSLGYSNASMFQKKSENEKKGKTPEIKKLSLINSKLIIENQTKFKFFQIETRKLSARLKYKNSGSWSAAVSADAHIHDFTFNTEKGSFLKNKDIRADFQMGYSADNQRLTIPLQNFKIDKDPILLGGEFYFDRKPVVFSLKITSNSILYKNAIALLSPNIHQKLEVIDLSKPISINASIIGKMKFRDTPLVRVAWNIKNNEFITPAGQFTQCNFTGAFTNCVDTAKGHNDPNSRITLYEFDGKWYGIPVLTDTVTIHDLIHPHIQTRIRSQFPLEKLNNIVDSHLFSFNKGTAQFDLTYQGGLHEKSNIQPLLNGHIIVQELGMHYFPRNLTFVNSDLRLIFKDDSVYLQNGVLKSLHNEFHIHGGVKNLLNFYFHDPQKVVFNWNIKTQKLNLNEFHSFLQPRKKQLSKKNTHTSPSKQLHTHSFLNKVNHQLDELLDLCNVNMSLQVKDLLYRRFEARDIHAQIVMRQNQIHLKNMGIKYAGGNISLNALIQQKGNQNKLLIQSDIQNVDVSKFFYGMENFGLKTLTDSNIKGFLSAHTDIAVSVSDTGKIVPHSMQGKVNFNLKDGALLNFEPLSKIGKIIFRRRDLSHVTFRDISNTLELDGNKIHINPMRIESSVLVLQVEGIYSFGKGTNILIDVPLRNPKKDELIVDEQTRAERSMKGIVLYVNAYDGEDGKIKFKLINKKNSDEKKQERKQKWLQLQGQAK